MTEARNRIGFDTDGNQIYVQVYPSREGGCEMFVTKLGLLASQRHPRILERGALEGGMDFVFESMEDLLAACRRLKALALLGNSAAYRSDEGGYFLLLDAVSFGRPPSLDRSRLLSVIEEYGRRQNADVVRLYIREHAEIICEKNAVERLSGL